MVEGIVSRDGDKCQLDIALADVEGALIVINIARKRLGLLVVGFETEAVSIGVDVELHVLVLASQTGGIKRHASRYSIIGGSHADSSAGVGIEFSVVAVAILVELGMLVVTREVGPHFQRQLAVRAFHIEGVIGTLLIVFAQHAVHTFAHHITFALGRGNQERNATS